jgi:hypothetical protein
MRLKLGEEHTLKSKNKENKGIILRIMDQSDRCLEEDAKGILAMLKMISQMHFIEYH